MRSVRRLVAGLAGVLLLAGMLLWTTGIAAAGRSPAGLVTDEAEVLSAGQLQEMDRALTGLRYQYRVLILKQAFSGEKPADAEARFRELAGRLMGERNVPKDAVLVTVAIKERLVDFRVWADGPVNREFRDRLGRDFASYSDVMLERFRGPAGAGDMAGGILAAVKAIEGLVPAAAPVVPSTAPSVVPSQPEPFRAPVSEPVATPSASDAGRVLVGIVAGAAVVLGAGFWLRGALRYRRGHRDLLALRDSFLGDLLQLMEREMPLARTYQGEETRGAVAAATTAAEVSLQMQQAGEALRLKAGQLARVGRFRAALGALAEAGVQYQKAHSACLEAKRAWEPVSQALRTWEPASVAADESAARAGHLLSGERSRTGWPLNRLDDRRLQAAARLDLGRSRRNDDPAMAMRLVRDATAEFDGVWADAGALTGLQQALDAQRTRRQEADAAVEEMRRTTGLRFVELTPEPARAQALEREQEAEGALPEGDVPRVREALARAEAAVGEVQAILTRYREALAQYPEKSAWLTAELAVMAQAEQEAAVLLADLTRRFAPEDWSDVAGVARDAGAFRLEAAAGLQEVTRLTSPAEQRYLQAVELLDGWIARREALRQALGVLRDRPAALDALAREASAQVGRMENDVNYAGQVIMRESLRLPPDLDAVLMDARRRLEILYDTARREPLAVHRWSREASDGVALAARLKADVEELARMAAAARAELMRAQREAGSALGYERFDRWGHASALRGALAAADAALYTGNYAMALAECNRVLQACRGLESAYQEYLAEQRREEERRREEQRRHEESHHDHHSSSSSSGGGGSWGSSSSSSSDDRTSGGGGSW